MACFNASRDNIIVKTQQTFASKQPSLIGKLLYHSVTKNKWYTYLKPLIRGLANSRCNSYLYSGGLEVYQVYQGLKNVGRVWYGIVEFNVHSTQYRSFRRRQP